MLHGCELASEAGLELLRFEGACEGPGQCGQASRSKGAAAGAQGQLRGVPLVLAPLAQLGPDVDVLHLAPTGGFAIWQQKPFLDRSESVHMLSRGLSMLESIF
jgi:hypothetical protein